MMKKLFGALSILCLGSVALAGLAFAQTPGVPNPYAITSPTGQEQINVLGAGPWIESVLLTQVRDAGGYALVVPTTGTTFQAPADVGVIHASPAATIAAWTVVTPVAPVDGQRLAISSTQIITAMILSASAGQTVIGGTVSSSFAAVNGNVEFIYSLATSTWYRIQ